MFSTGWGEKSRKWSIANKSGLSAKILGVDGRVLLSHLELVCLVFVFFHCCCCSSPLCDLPSIPPPCAWLFSHKYQSVNSLFSFFLKPLLVYDLSITVVLLFKFFFLSCSVERAWFSLCFPKCSFETFCKLHTYIM